ncbi:metalloregulator ArsR/SmtB family transcription factor [Mycobacterium sp. 050128]|uniref:ArsR/SmtB family transcription factor n=1 Tax=Mycobacterium sp. 050128 TaxID=3096112 RepID=UPI002EDAF5C7
MAESPLDTCDLLCLDLPHAESIRESLPSLGRIEVFAARARALSDPTRFTIAVALLTGDELCVCDMAWVVSQSQNLVSHHLRQLKVAKLVSARRSGRLVMYRLTEQGRELTTAVMALSVSPAQERDDV